MRLFVLKTFVCVLFAASAVQGGITTADVRVRVTSPGCDKLKDVYLIVNGDERHPVKLDPDGTCRWRTDLGDDTISTSTASFSLRADLKRSGCKKAEAIELKNQADLVFSCCEGPFRNVNVKIEPPMLASYDRYVRSFAADRNPVGCREFSMFEKGQGAINSAKFEDEDVYLHLGPFNPKRQPVGLFLNKVVVDDGTLVLTRDDVVYRMTVQRAKGQTRTTPTFSSNAISVDIKILGDLKFERAEFQVIK